MLSFLEITKLTILFKLSFAATFLIAADKDTKTPRNSISTGTLSHEFNDVYSIVSTESFSGTEYSTAATPYFRLRAVKIDRLRAEYPPYIYVDKVSLGIPKSGEYTLYFREVINVPDTKRMEEAKKKFTAEELMWCCDYTDIKWEGFKLSFLFTAYGLKYNCEIKDANSSLAPVCKPITK